MGEQGIRLAVDIGGTFTDVVLEAHGKTHTYKLLTTHSAPERAFMDGALLVLQQANMDPSDVDFFVHGTTLATNAIIERRGAITALITTDGFRDVIEIADEGRYDQYDVFLRKPPALIPRSHRFTVAERTGASGDIIRPLKKETVEALIPQLRSLDIESVAIVFLHSYANASHEERARSILHAAMPALDISISSEVCPEVREYERSVTTCANAYVQPIVAGYLRRLAEELVQRGFRCSLYLITSSGGLTTLEAARGHAIRLVESGPAGGAILACEVARRSSLHKALSFDMGGTTAKVCLIEHAQPEMSRTFEVDRAARFIKGSGLPLRIPVVEMVEIGAGGGSIAKVDELGRIVVGPESAGSDPGPACYPGGGVHPTVTDADLALGKLLANWFAGGKTKLSLQDALTALRKDLGGPLACDALEAAYGVTEIVEENMSNAARVHAVEKGKVIDDYSIIAFGGAAPLHACRLAEKLGVTQIVVPENAGVGSAVGFLWAPASFEAVRSRFMRLSAFDAMSANEVLEEMAASARAIVRAASPCGELTVTSSAFMRYSGQGQEIEVKLPARGLGEHDGCLLRESFESLYAVLFGRTIQGAEIEVLTWAVRVRAAENELEDRPRAPPPESHAEDSVPMHPLVDRDTRKVISVPVYRREQLGLGTTIEGPALIAERDTTTFVASSFSAHIDIWRSIVLRKKSQKRSAHGT